MKNEWGHPKIDSMMKRYDLLIKNYKEDHSNLTNYSKEDLEKKLGELNENLIHLDKNISPLIVHFSHLLKVEFNYFFIGLISLLLGLQAIVSITTSLFNDKVIIFFLVISTTVICMIIIFLKNEEKNKKNKNLEKLYIKLIENMDFLHTYLFEINQEIRKRNNK